MSTAMSKISLETASYSELGDLSGIDKAVWSRWFNGKKSPSLDTLRPVAEKLGVSLWVLVRQFEKRRDRVLAEKN